MLSRLVILLYLVALACAIFCVILNHFLRKENVPSRVRQSYIRKLISVWIGASIAVSCNVNIKPFPEPVLTYLESDGTLTNRDSHLTRVSLANEPRVILITTTDYSVTQVPLLVRIAQALYPVRQNVIWIVVALPLESVDDHMQIMNTENLTFGAAISRRNDLQDKYIENLRKLLNRYGVPFVLLPSYEEQVTLRSKWNGFKWAKTEDRILQGYQTGLLWALKNLSRGVLILGDMEYVYNSALFTEMYDIDVACWPVGLNSDNTGISTPIFKIHNAGDGKTTKTTIIGHFYGTDVRFGFIFIERGAFAIDINYLRNTIPYQDQWKLAYDGVYTSKDLGIDLKQISVLGNHGTQILVWRTEMMRMSWPNLIKVRKDFVTEDTNLKPLMEGVFGPRFYLMKDLVVNAENDTHYEEYDMNRDLRSYI